MSVLSEPMVDANALASLLEVNRETVYRLARSGAIPSIRVGRVWRFYPSEVKERLAQPHDPWKQSARSRTARRRVA
jgi:excisionase family DNA binding protein